ncbi:hypothetical protein [Fulvivirga ligni]|uniref:hypothetical protein n=1 Tax=Fulvivirga ligni TaxID=2904246 RepID=UPI001F280014|nr:hypothetical protein [Fulvivirga ligni]UII23205.1 hypothetical protein LVD16_08190 [Fulvivirga ligni]
MFEYKIDAKGHIIEEKRYQYDMGDDVIRTEKFIYNEEGKVIEEISVPREGEASTTTFEYDKNGFLIFENDLFGSKYVNDEKGNIIAEYSVVDGDEELVSGYRYNENGLVKEFKEYSNSKCISTICYEYVLDNHNNWVRRMEFLINGSTDYKRTLSKITFRKIKYAD